MPLPSDQCRECGRKAARFDQWLRTVLCSYCWERYGPIPPRLTALQFAVKYPAIYARIVKARNGR